MTLISQPLAAKSDAELDALINNHRNHIARGGAQQPIYTEALAERARRKGQGLSFETSLLVIAAAAREGRYVGYKKLAEESGADWARVHWSVGPHLDQMLEYCFRKGWPLLPAIVVKTDDVETGRLRGSSLDGFVEGCAKLGIDIPDDHEAFADTEQQKVFEWARSGAPV